MGENWQFSAGCTRDSTSHPQKFKSVLYDWLYLQLWSKCIRGLGSTSLKWSACGPFCAIALGCCTFSVEKVLFPNFGQFWLSGAGEGSFTVLKVVAGDATAEVSVRILPVCWCRGSEPGLNVANMVGWALPGECPQTLKVQQAQGTPASNLPGMTASHERTKTAPRRRCFHPRMDTRSAWPIVYFCLR